MFLILLASCVSSKKITEEIIWINSTMKPCTGVAPTQCMEIQTGNKLQPNAWTLFYDKIEGFNYQPGNIYKIKVSVEDLNIKDVPADSSTKKYKLIEIMKEEIDRSLILNDIWVLTHIQNKEIDLDNEEQRPRIELNLSENKIFGKGVCNRFTGAIKKRNATELELDENFATTRMMCPNIELEDQFFQILSLTKKYTITNNHLLLFNNDNKEIMKFKKID